MENPRRVAPGLIVPHIAVQIWQSGEILKILENQYREMRDGHGPDEIILRGEPTMIGMTMKHPQSGKSGTVDAVSVDPQGRAMARICDAWFFVDECEG